MKKLLGKEVKIGEKYGEITSIIGCAYEVTFFNVNDGKTCVYPDEIEKILVRQENT